ncbi:MAG: CinA family protein [Candidatus Bipolaricaulota bacterium]|nr:CinA family protein [Candidatus Bipolaricaulota bacterium]MDW8126435.1 CinA family protein [Candidatus Bipolaricaulota bacterium]
MLREAEVGELLRARGLTLAVAESCTGGLLGMRLTEVPGASDYFRGGLIAYSNAVKQELLGVPGEVLAKHGAVSPECARAMAEGARRLFRVDLALAITGIAGPTGGTPEKPVGLVYIALAHPQGVVVERHDFRGSRQGVRWSASEAALALLCQHLEGR